MTTDICYFCKADAPLGKDVCAQCEREAVIRLVVFLVMTIPVALAVFAVWRVAQL